MVTELKLLSETTAVNMVLKDNKLSDPNADMLSLSIESEQESSTTHLALHLHVVGVMWTLCLASYQGQFLLNLSSPPHNTQE